MYVYFLENKSYIKIILVYILLQLGLRFNEQPLISDILAKKLARKLI